MKKNNFFILLLLFPFLIFAKDDNIVWLQNVVAHAMDLEEINM